MTRYSSWAFGAYSLAGRLCIKLIVKQRVVSGDPLNKAAGTPGGPGAAPGCPSPFPPVAPSGEDVWE